MKMLIINTEIAEKLRNTNFGGWDILDPVIGEINGSVIYYLLPVLKEVKTFEKALADFEVCEIKEIETIETTLDKGSYKTILTETIVIK
jgi:hypothetical protein